MQQKQNQKIAYRISEANNIVHRFSPVGYELLSDEFIDYLERRRAAIPKDAQLEISVESDPSVLTQEQLEAINRAYRGHYLLQLSEAETRMKKAQIRILWFLLSTIVSSALLLIVKPQTEEWLVQFAYVPIWFFGYRILIYCIFDLPAIWKDICWRKQLLSAKLFFMGHEFSCDTKKEIGSHRGSFVKSYFMEGNTVLLECISHHAPELLCEGCTEGTELITGELAAYLEQAVPFLEKKHSVRLTIGGEKLCEQTLKRIQNGIKNHFSLRLNEVDEQLRDNRSKILLFAVALCIISFVLYAVGSRLDVRYHEIVLIILWFFADYLCEFLLLIPLELHKQRNRWLRMENMEVTQNKEGEMNYESR